VAPQAARRPGAALNGVERYSSIAFGIVINIV